MPGDTVTGPQRPTTTGMLGTGKTLTVDGGTVNDGNGGNNYIVTLVHRHHRRDQPGRPDHNGADQHQDLRRMTPARQAYPRWSGLQAGDTVTGLSEIYDNRNAGTGKTLSVDTYTVNDGNGGAQLQRHPGGRHHRRDQPGHPHDNRDHG